MARILRNVVESGVLQTYFDQRFDTPTVAGGYGSMSQNPLPNGTGYLLFSVTFTPKKIGSTLMIEADTYGRETANSGDIFLSSVEKDSDTNALAVGFQGKANDGASLNTASKTLLFHPFVTTSLTPIDFRIRCGMDGGNTFVLNTIQSTAAAFTHSQQGSWIRIIEYGV